MEIGPVRYAHPEEGVNIAYRVLGDGPTVIHIVAGGPSGVEGRLTISVHLRYLERAASLGFRLVIYDQRGTGLSLRDVEEISTETKLADLSAVIEATHAASVILVSETMGGGVALSYAHAHPERVDALILDGTFGSGGDVPGIDELISLLEANYPVGARAIMDIPFPGAPEVVEAHARVIRESADAATSARIWRTAFHADVTALLPEIKAPTLVRHQTRARNTPEHKARELAGQIPDAELQMLSWDNPIPLSDAEIDESWLMIREFVDRRVPTGAAERGASQPASTTHEQSSSGFATILFTDVVASTPLLTQLRDERMREVMRDHDTVCEAAITTHGGRVVKTIGDAFMAEFGVPSAAIEAAIAIQRGIRAQFQGSEVPVRLRIGINAGEPIAVDDDLHGASVVIAKRLESEAETDGILVSDVVRQAVAGKDFEFDDSGEVELKGFDEPLRAWAVRWD